MNKYIKAGLGLVAGVAAGIAIYEVFKRRSIVHQGRPPFAEAAENGED